MIHLPTDRVRQRRVCVSCSAFLTVRRIVSLLLQPSSFFSTIVTWPGTRQRPSCLSHISVRHIAYLGCDWCHCCGASCEIIALKQPFGQGRKREENYCNPRLWLPTPTSAADWLMGIWFFPDKENNAAVSSSFRRSTRHAWGKSAAQVADLLRCCGRQ
jgi:hypothetical protein